MDILHVFLRVKIKSLKNSQKLKKTREDQQNGYFRVKISPLRKNTKNTKTDTFFEFLSYAKLLKLKLKYFFMSKLFS